MDNFSFLKSLNKSDEKINESFGKKPKLTSGIKYEEYSVVMFDDKEKTVFIPVREVEVFEAEVSNTDILTETVMRGILRKCNGVTEI